MDAVDYNGALVKSQIQSIDGNSTGRTIAWTATPPGDGRLWQVDEGAGDCSLVTCTPSFYDYAYDSRGNRIDGQGVSATTPEHDAQDRLITWGDISFTYTPAGELETKQVGSAVTTFTYDALGALRHVDLPGATPDIDYLIDGAGRRVGKKVGGALERT